MSAPVRVPTRPGAISGSLVAVPPRQSGVPYSATPTIHYVPPRAGGSNGAWKSAGMFLEFEIPKSVGVLNTTTLRFTVNNAGSAVPTPSVCHFVQQVEISIGSTLLETIYPEDIRNETVGFLTGEGLLSQGQMLYEPTAVAPSEPATLASLPAGLSYNYLPFNNCLTTAGLYANGIKYDPIVYRVYFPAGLFNNSADITLADCTLIVNEDNGTAVDDNSWEGASDKGIVYSTVLRQRQNTSITKNGNTDYTLELSSLNGASAGFVIYVGPSVVPGGSSTFVSPASPSGAVVQNNQLLTTTYPLDALELNNRMGNKKTEKLRGKMLTDITWYDQTKTSYAKTNTVYLMPFCANFKDAVENGNVQGFMYTDGTDRLVISGSTHASTLSTDVWDITVTNYVYAGLVIKNGRLSAVARV